MAAPEQAAGAESVTICLDAGTSRIKAVAFDSQGYEIGVAERSTSVDVPRPGWSEQDMTQVWESSAGAVAELVRGIDLPVRALALTAQGDGAWLVDAQDRPVRPAVLWNDARAVGVLERWQAEEVLTRAYEVNGSLGNLGLPDAVLATLQVDEPEVLARADAVLTCGSWLFLRLTGRRGLHVSEASAPWLDVRGRCYDDALLQMHGLSDLRRLLPPLLVGRDAVAPLGEDVAARFGLPAGLPVVLAPYDVVATAVGSGVTDPGQAYSVLGTTLCTGTLLEEVDTTGTAAGLTLALDRPDRWLRAFPTLAGTGVVDTMVRLLGLSGPSELGDLAAQSPPGAAGVRMWPYLSPAGERAPFLDTGATGVLAGLELHHDRCHLARAALEGLAHVVRDCVEAAGVEASELRLSGGGAGSDVWVQVIADVTGLPTVRTDDAQVGAKGAMVHAVGLLEGVHAGEAGRQDVTQRLVRLRDVHRPDPAAAALLDVRHRAFVEDRVALAQRWSRWRSGRTPS